MSMITHNDSNSQNHLTISTQKREEIKEYLKQRTKEGATFYVQKINSHKLKRVKYKLTDIDGNLIDYFLAVENERDKIFIKDDTGVRRVSFI